MSFLTTCCFAFQTKLNGNKKEGPTVLGVRKDLKFLVLLTTQLAE